MELSRLLIKVIKGESDLKEVRLHLYKELDKSIINGDETTELKRLIEMIEDE